MKFAVINETAGMLATSPVAYYIAAQNYQLSQHFLPAWGLTGYCRLASSTSDVKPDEVPLHLLKNATQAGALGYHDDPGRVEAFAFVETAAADGVTWESVASHEVLETLADPMINQLGLTGAYGGVAWEVADAVEDIYVPLKFTDGHVVKLSDFVLPAWFVEGSSGKMSFMSAVHAPLAVTPGGYFSYTTDLRNWKQMTGNRAAAHLTAELADRYLTRRARRSERAAKMAPAKPFSSAAPP